MIMEDDPHPEEVTLLNSTIKNYLDNYDETYDLKYKVTSHSPRYFDFQEIKDDLPTSDIHPNELKAIVEDGSGRLEYEFTNFTGNARLIKVDGSGTRSVLQNYLPGEISLNLPVDITEPNQYYIVEANKNQIGVLSNKVAFRFFNFEFEPIKQFELATSGDDIG